MSSLQSSGEAAASESTPSPDTGAASTPKTAQLERFNHLCRKVGVLLNHSDEAVRVGAVAEFVSQAFAIFGATPAPSPTSSAFEDIGASAHSAQRTWHADGVERVLKFVGRMVRSKRWVVRRCGCDILERLSEQYDSWSLALENDFASLDSSEELAVGRSEPGVGAGGSAHRSQDSTPIVQRLDLDRLVQRGLPLLAFGKDQSENSASGVDSVAQFVAQRDAILNVITADSSFAAGSEAIQHSKMFLETAIAPEDLMRQSPLTPDLVANKTISATEFAQQISKRKETASATNKSACAVTHTHWRRTPFLSFCSSLRTQLLSAEWHVRHGCANALLRVLSFLPSQDSTRGGNRSIRWIEDCLVRCLCVLGLDRFGDYSGDSAVRPAAEAAAQLLGVLVTLLGTGYARTGGIFQCLLHLQKNDGNSGWQVRHSALLAARYLFRALSALYTEEDMIQVLSQAPQQNRSAEILTDVSYCQSVVLQIVEQGVSKDPDGDVLELCALLFLDFAKKFPHRLLEGDFVTSVSTTSSPNVKDPAASATASLRLRNLYHVFWNRILQAATTPLDVAGAPYLITLLRAARKIYDLLTKSSGTGDGQFSPSELDVFASPTPANTPSAAASGTDKVGDYDGSCHMSAGQFTTLLGLETNGWALLSTATVSRIACAVVEFAFVIARDSVQPLAEARTGSNSQVVTHFQSKLSGKSLRIEHTLKFLNVVFGVVAFGGCIASDTPHREMHLQSAQRSAVNHLHSESHADADVNIGIESVNASVRRKCKTLWEAAIAQLCQQGAPSAAHIVHQWSACIACMPTLKVFLAILSGKLGQYREWVPISERDTKSESARTSKLIDGATSAALLFVQLALASDSVTNTVPTFIVDLGSLLDNTWNDGKAESDADGGDAFLQYLMRFVFFNTVLQLYCFRYPGQSMLSFTSGAGPRASSSLLQYAMQFFSPKLEVAAPGHSRSVTVYSAALSRVPQELINACIFYVSVPLTALVHYLSRGAGLALAGTMEMLVRRVARWEKSPEEVPNHYKHLIEVLSSVQILLAPRQENARDHQPASVDIPAEKHRALSTNDTHESEAFTLEQWLMLLHTSGNLQPATRLHGFFQASSSGLGESDSCDDSLEDSEDDGIDDSTATGLDTGFGEAINGAPRTAGDLVRARVESVIRTPRHVLHIVAERQRILDVVKATISILAARRQALAAENASGAIFASIIEARRATDTQSDAKCRLSSGVDKPSLSKLLESLKWQHNLKLQSRSAAVIAQVCCVLLQWESTPAKALSVGDSSAQHNQQASHDLLSKVLSNIIKYLRPDMQAFERWNPSLASEAAALPASASVRESHDNVRTVPARHFINHTGWRAGEADQRFPDAVWQRGAALVLDNLLGTAAKNLESGFKCDAMEVLAVGGHSSTHSSQLIPRSGFLYRETLQYLEGNISWTDVSHAEQFCLACFSGISGSASTPHVHQPKVANEFPKLKDCFVACGNETCLQGLPRVGCGFRSELCRSWLLCRLRHLAVSPAPDPVDTRTEHHTITVTTQSHAKLVRKRLLRVSQSLRFYRILVSAAKKGLCRRRNFKQRQNPTNRGVSSPHRACEHLKLFPTLVALLPSILTLALQLTLCSSRLKRSACTAWQTQPISARASILLGRTLQLQLDWLAIEVRAATQDILDSVVDYGQTFGNAGSFERDSSALHLACYTLLRAMKFPQNGRIACHEESCLQSVAAEMLHYVVVRHEKEFAGTLGSSVFAALVELCYNSTSLSVRTMSGHCVGIIAPLLPLSVGTQDRPTTPGCRRNLEFESNFTLADRHLLIGLIYGQNFSGLAAQAPIPQFALELLTASLQQSPSPACGFDPAFTLRQYQLKGIQWLWLLRRVGLHGLLSDDMGLGKTLQTLLVVVADAFAVGRSHQLLHKQTAHDQSKPWRLHMSSIVICPASLVDHWIFECRKYFGGSVAAASPVCEGLLVVVRPLRYHSVSRDRREGLLREVATITEGELPDKSILAKYSGIVILHVIVTSYKVAVSDRVALSRVQWNNTTSKPAGASNFGMVGTRPFQYCVLDEAHKISNPRTQISQACKLIGGHAAHRVALTGTPVSNSAMDVWSIFDFLMPGYLGSKEVFSVQYEAFVKEARHHHRYDLNGYWSKSTAGPAVVPGKTSAEMPSSVSASQSGTKVDAQHVRQRLQQTTNAGEGHGVQNRGAAAAAIISSNAHVAKMNEALLRLHKRIASFILRRTKQNVLTELPPKIISDRFCEATPVQKQYYQDFLEAHGTHQEILETAQSTAATASVPAQSSSELKIAKCPTAGGITTIRRLLQVCVHPLLVFDQRESLLAARRTHDKSSDQLRAKKTRTKRLCELTSLEHSGKLKALGDLLLECGIHNTAAAAVAKAQTLRMPGQAAATASCFQHRVLVFAQHRRALDLVEQILLDLHPCLDCVKFLRLDGTVAAGTRQAIVDRFNQDPEIPILLLTTGVGGLGLNLTGADTVIFLEHDWNPQKDLQAMDRAHRLGQRHRVNVYRLITRGTIEEHVMALQHFKIAVSAGVVRESEQATPDTMRFNSLLDNIASGPKSMPRPKKTLVGRVADAQVESEYSDLNPELFSSRITRARMTRVACHARGGSPAPHGNNRAALVTDTNKKRPSEPACNTSGNVPVDKRHRP